MEPTLNPYLIFNGNAADAMKFYQSVYGGKVTMQTFAEAKMVKAKGEEHRIIHAALTSGPLTLMSSDSPMDPNRQAKFGNNVQLSVMGTDASKLTNVYNRLAEGGKVEMPLAKQFWGDTFGMVTDKFGIRWMISITGQPPSRK